MRFILVFAFVFFVIMMIGYAYRRIKRVLSDHKRLTIERRKQLDKINAALLANTADELHPPLSELFDLQASLLDDITIPLTNITDKDIDKLITAFNQIKAQNQGNTVELPSPQQVTPQDSAQVASVNHVVPTNNDSGRFRLLLVDDDPVNLVVLNGMLSTQNYPLVEVSDGYQALEAIDKNGPFDLVLLDIMMPGLSGYEVCKKIRESQTISELPIIFLTAKNGVDDLVQGFAAGANDHLTKPVSQYELLSRVALHLELLTLHRNLDRMVCERTEQIMAAQKKLILSEKLASLGTLMAGVAHEIKNPSHFVSLSVDNLKLDLGKCQQFIFDLAGENADEAVLDSLRAQFEPLHEHIKTIAQGTMRINNLAKDLKTTSHMNDSEKEMVCITDILASTINLASAKYKTEVELITDFKATPTINCFPAKLSQVFMNLIVNACDALLQKCEDTGDKTRGKVVIGCQLSEQWVVITVKDNGCGMTADTKNKLFDPFFTTKGIDKGTGLGLFISADIVKVHDGELTVESELGVGSVFVG